MISLITREINHHFFKKWNHEMAYILGYVIADGCIYKRKDRKNSYVFNITSKDRKHLVNINKCFKSNYSISKKYNSQKLPCFQIQICNNEICKDLLNLGILPRKTYNLEPLSVPKRYFSDFVRGFFDGDGSVYIYKINGVWQIKSEFVSSSIFFLKEFNKQLCNQLKINQKNIHRNFSKHKNLPQYSICFYIDDSLRLAEFMYSNKLKIYLARKFKIFKRWKLMKRRQYIKKHYPSKIGWYFNKKISIQAPK